MSSTGIRSPETWCRLPRRGEGARVIHARRVQLIGGGAHGAEHHSFTGVRMGAPLAFSSTTTILAGSVLLALRPTT
jgi:hypothetical protein